MLKISLRVTKPRHQPLGLDLATNLGEFRTDIAADHFGLATSIYSDRVAGNAKHLVESSLAIFDCSLILSVAAHDPEADPGWRNRLDPLHTQIGRDRSQ